MANPLFWILERLYYPKGTAMPVEDYPENTFYSYTGELPEVDEYNDSAYFHEQLDEILAELRKLVKATGPIKVTVGDPTVVGGDFINPHTTIRGSYTWNEVNPRVYDNIVRGSN